MPKKRRNNGRNKKHKGHSDPIHCENCKRLVPKDKAIKRFLIKNMVDASSKRDIEDASVYPKEEYSMPRLFILWCGHKRYLQADGHRLFPRLLG